MVWPLLSNGNPIGLDIGERYIKAVQLASAGRRHRVVAAGAIARPDAAAGMTGPEVRQLRKRLLALGMKGQRIVLAVPCEKLLTGIMELPPAESGAPIEMLARSELARMHKCDPQSFEMASWELPAPARAANTTFMMGAACIHADADNLLDCFEAEGLRVERLEIQSQALARACGPLLNKTRGLAGILDIGWTTPRLVLLYDGVVIYDRKLARSAYGGLVGELVDQLGQPTGAIEEMLFTGRNQGAVAQALAAARQRYAARLADEMRIPLSYVSNQYPDANAEQLLLVGGGARLEGLAETLAEAMDWPVRSVAMSDLTDCEGQLDAECGPALVAATGLAWTTEV